jgi:hypothetical protein
MSEIAIGRPRTGGLGQFVADLNGRYHRAALWTFLAITVAHWAEHLVQAFQVWGLGWERPEARGVLGLVFPWLVSSEALHYFYAIVMLVGLLLLRPGFTGRARTWWNVALIIQFWHHIEHALLLGQHVAGSNLFGKEIPTSIAQLAIMRVELHLLYNALVFIPMGIAMWLHVHPTEDARGAVSCTCAAASRRELAGAHAH